MKTRHIFIFLIALGISLNAEARKNPNKAGNKGSAAANPKSINASCAPGAGRTDMDLNNVRTTIFTSGDMWWDLNSNPRYEIPKGSNKHSMFAGALWLGGLDGGGNLKSAAMTYRQNGNDFWPGPLKMADASTEASICNAYDRHWKITRQEVEEYYLGGAMTEVVQEWPGNGIDDGIFPGFDSEIAPFVDGNGNGIYEPELRDDQGFAIEYPAYDITGDLGCDARLYGDQTLWWVFNDNGNIHTETGGFPLGMEIRAQAFEFATNNALNDMTFYNYELYNRSSFTVNETYFGVWTDPDVGNYTDDFAGCDVARGLGYVYNGDENDETVFGYGENPPAIGVDYFEGPFKDPNGVDDTSDFCVEPRAAAGLGFGDGIIDNERLGMARFIYYTSTGPNYANDPDNGQHVYNYLRGIWKDGTEMVFQGASGNGYGTGDAYAYMFPGNSDPRGIGYMIAGSSQTCLPEDQPLESWSIDQLGAVPPSDFRILQSAGPFTLTPGQFNKLTFGVVWGRATSGGRLASVAVVRRVDDDAQALFDNCFKLLEGPQAPPVDVVELDREIILNFNPCSVKQPEDYTETTAIPGFGDVTYEFQGYMIYQLKDLSVTTANLKDANSARLVDQVDIKDDVINVVNRYYDQDIEENIPSLEVAGENQGIRKSFRVTTDLFATGDNRLVNHKKYYFLILAYAVPQDDSLRLNPEFPTSFVAGRRTCGAAELVKYTAIPHIPAPESGGLNIRAEYGDIPSLKRIEGYGNGGNVVDLTDETVAEIMQSPYWTKNPVYQKNAGPVAVKVVNPKVIPQAKFELKILSLDPDSSDYRWQLTKIDDNGGTETVIADRTISDNIEQVISDWGLSVSIEQVPEPAELTEGDVGYITSTEEYENNQKRWLSFIGDEEGCDNAFNWIRSGFQEADDQNPDCGDVIIGGEPLDPTQTFESVAGGTWAPFMCVSRFDNGPAYSTAAAIQSRTYLRRISSVDIVFTPDKSKWSRCVVLETGDDLNFNVGGADKLNLRASPSVNKEGQPDGDGTGMGWFPGYALNVETGERLNIAFGESSRLTEDNGRDMMFNPSSRTAIFDNGAVRYIFGGKHFVYVFDAPGAPGSANEVPRYDECNWIRQKLQNPTAANKRDVYKAAAWVSIPYATPNQDFLTNELKIRIRVNKPYQTKYNASEEEAAPVNDNNPMYSFNTDDLYAGRNDEWVADAALNLINVVPNPYYAYAGYETNQLDNRVKITNLPQECKIRIYTMNGSLIRTYNKADASTSLDWDLKNQVGISISSGIYLIHVEVPGVGEKILKWFGVMRPIDLDTF
ncbi:MAG: T9SS type A sorting domain-containing protein [Bacteroidia bacterium]